MPENRTALSQWNLSQVTAYLPRPGVLSRTPPALTLERSGRGTMNILGSELLLELANAAGFKDQPFAARFGIDPEKQIIGIYPAQCGTPGTVPVNWTPGKRRAVVYLHAILEHHTAMRADYRRLCQLQLGEDTSGNRCLILSLTSAQIKRARSRTRRSPGETTT
ncbi:MAG: hypothetical protein ACM3XM_09730 [Mycobacterium leprae]